MRYTSCDLKREILRVLLYADIFDHALTPEEVRTFLPIKVDPDTVKRALKRMDVFTDGTRYALRRECLKRSREGAENARRILKENRLALRLLASLPFVRGIFVTGSVATGNANDRDDLDLLIITGRGRLYTARLFVMLLVKVFPGLCPNFFVGEGNFRFEPENYYQAREFAQMLPVYGKEVYENILEQNRWVYGRFPNFSPRRSAVEVKPFAILKRFLEILARLLPESYLRTLQLRRFLRRGHRMDEVVVGDEIFKAHVSGHGLRIQEEYERRLREYGL